MQPEGRGTSGVRVYSPRHSFFHLSRDVVTGQVLAHLFSPSNRSRFSCPSRSVSLLPDPAARRWRFVVHDNLNVHLTHLLVHWSSFEVRALNLDLGEKGKSGILHNKKRPCYFSRILPIASSFTTPQALLLAQSNQKSGLASLSVNCSNEALFLLLTNSRPKYLPSSTITMLLWPSPTNGPTRANHLWPNHWFIYAGVY